MKISFVQPMNISMIGEKIFPLDLKTSLPMETIGYGMLHIATYLKKICNTEVSVYSLSSAYKTKTFHKIIKKILSSDVVAIELNWVHYTKGALKLAEYIKKINKNIKIVIGGIHASIFAKELIKKPYVDFVIRGEGKIPMYELVTKKFPLNEKIKGVVSKKRDGGLPRIIKNIDEIPHMILHLLKPMYTHQCILL